LRRRSGSGHFAARSCITRCTPLEAGVAAADAFQSIRGVEAEQVGEGMPLQHPGIDLPFIAMQREIRAFAVRISQGCVELLGTDPRKLQLAGGLFEAQALVAAQTGANQHCAGACQEKYQCRRSMRHSAQEPPPAQAANRRNEKQQP
jgi:hypothetical protein